MTEGGAGREPTAQLTLRPFLLEGRACVYRRLSVHLPCEEGALITPRGGQPGAPHQSAPTGGSANPSTSGVILII